MKIGIFYSKYYFYLSAFHPFLFEELKRKENDEFLLCDVSSKSIDEINIISEKLDLIVIDHSIIFSISKDYNNNFYKNIYLYNDTKNSIFFEEVFNVLINKKCKKYFWFHGDAHGIKISVKDRIDGLGEYIDSICKECDGYIYISAIKKYVKKDEIDSKYLDSGFDTFELPYDILSEKLKNKPIIEALFPIDKKKIGKRKNKIWDVNISGQLYKPREIALKSFVDNGLKICNYNTFSNKFLNFVNDRFVKKIDFKAGLEMNNYVMKRQMMNSAISFTCGSAFKYFVFKFLEIQAFDSLLMIYPSKDIEDYGYIDGVNSIFTAPEEAGINAKKILGSKSIIEKIKNNAIQNILKNHTVEVRAQQLIKALQLAAEDKLVESKFVNGNYEYFTK